MFHWTEPKIRVHAFYCVLALAVAHLMRREAHQAGLDLSVRELLTSLAAIQETVLIYPTGNKGRPRAHRILTDTDPTQKRLIKLFGLTKYAPNAETWVIQTATTQTAPEQHVYHSTAE